MTAEEIKKIADIMMDADGGCWFCASDLLRKFDSAFPGHAEEIDTAWVESGRSSNGWKED